MEKVEFEGGTSRDKWLAKTFMSEETWDDLVEVGSVPTPSSIPDNISEDGGVCVFAYLTWAGCEGINKILRRVAVLRESL